TRVSSPRAGTVEQVMYRQGEIVPPTAAVVRLSVGGGLTLRVFVPMSELSRVLIGQDTTVWLPDAGNRAANGKVSHIADQAEFTGRQPQTDSERNAQLVAVEIKLSQPEAAIKAGMPASVSFGGDEVGFVAPAVVVSGASVASLSFSGTLEERQTRVAAELEGQIRAVRVSRGDEVRAGDPLVSLDDAAVQNALGEAEAGVKAAQAELDRVTEPARPGALALADASVAQAQADLDSAQRSAADAARALASPQDLASQVHAWEGRVSAAKADITRADATVSDLQRQIDQARSDQSMAGKAALAALQKQAEAAQVNRSAAQITLDQSQKVFDLYQSVEKNPLDLVAARNVANGGIKIAEAGLEVAQAGRDIARRGPQAEAVALAQARVQVATANVALVEAQLKRLIVSSPVGGRVVDRQGEVGETARPGAALIALADPRELELTVYVPVREMGSVHAGQGAAVRLPSISGKTFDARVTYIASESEFKPANIYNSQDRSEMVFAVRLTVPNPNDELKAGLPADATLK
ncbi:MAG: efflux RND transporter periplasmic adaptor subunit, partial [Rudaea sp.]